MNFGSFWQIKVKFKQSNVLDWGLLGIGHCSTCLQWLGTQLFVGCFLCFCGITMCCTSTGYCCWVTVSWQHVGNVFAGWLWTRVTFNTGEYRAAFPDVVWRPVRVRSADVHDWHLPALRRGAEHPEDAKAPPGARSVVFLHFRVYCFFSVWPGLAWPGLAWPCLVWPGLAWPGLAWPGLVWSGLVWSKSSQARKHHPEVTA